MACNMKLTWMCNVEGLNATGMTFYATLNNQIMALHPEGADLLCVIGT